MSVGSDVAAIQDAMRRIAKLWNGQIQPRLARDPRLPAQFIVDVTDVIFAQVIRPIDELAAAQLRNAAVVSVGGKIVAIGGGGAGARISDQAADIITQLTKQATSTIDFAFERILTPLRNEAQRAIAEGGKKAMIGVVASGSDRFDQVVLTVMQAGANTLVRLQQVAEIADSSLLFRLADLGRRAGDAVVAFFQALGTAIATIGGAAYDLLKTLLFLAKVAVVGGIGYLGYRVYQDRQRALPAANPARRRRRRRRRAR